MTEDLIKMMGETQTILMEFQNKRKQVESKKKESSKEEEKQMAHEDVSSLMDYD